MCRGLLNRDGCSEGLRSGGAGDPGTDVIAGDMVGRRVVLQCKRCSRPPGNQLHGHVARPEVIQVLGSTFRGGMGGTPQMRSAGQGGAGQGRVWTGRSAWLG
ncbi:restriction endonuclease [Kitasatospora humi]|uniref:restriction endonuclease n=1 Tax=Kitasatospora humi TaxID=2893891 RepID=UPI0035590DC4